MKRTRTLFLTSALGGVLLTSNASAAIVIYQAVWSGESFNNNASAVGLIGIDTAAIPNPGEYFTLENLPDWLNSISITVTGASSGNGTFRTADFPECIGTPGRSHWI